MWKVCSSFFCFFFCNLPKYPIKFKVELFYAGQNKNHKMSNFGGIPAPKKIQNGSINTHMVSWYLDKMIGLLDIAHKCKKKKKKKNEEDICSTCRLCVISSVSNYSTVGNDSSFRNTPN